MKSFLTKLTAVATLSALVVGAYAQGGGAGGGGGRGGGRMFGQGRMGGGDWGLLSRKDVQTELKITDEQKTQITAAQEAQRESMRGAFQNFRDMSDDERQKAMQKMQEDQKKVYEGILTKEQATRLKELGIQRAGNGAILRPEVQKDLGITEEQKKKISELQTKQQEAQRALFEKVQNQEIERDQMQEAMRKNQEILGAELGKILTTEQADKLKKMGGAPFKFDPSEDRGRGGGGL